MVILKAAVAAFRWQGWGRMGKLTETWSITKRQNWCEENTVYHWS